MKYFLYLLICIVVLGLGTLFVLKKPDGTTWLSTSDFYNKHKIVNQIQQIKSTVTNKVNNVFETTDSSKIYKWQDQKGVWHYSDKKQDAKSGLKVENAATWNKPNNLTIIPSIDVNAVTKSIKNSTNKNNKEQQEIESLNFMPNKVNTLIKDTNNVQKLMDDRTKTIDAAL